VTTDATIPELFPRGVRDPLCSQGHVVETSTDRRLLWHLARRMSGCGDPHLRGQAQALSDYLHSTCEHHLHDWLTCCEPRGEGCYPPHRQCLWCHSVEWVDGPPVEIG